MHSNVNLPMTDSRRISPQTTASSGYHSDLSSATSTNQSPQSLHEIVSVPIDKSPRSSRTLSTLAMRVPKQNSSLIDNSVYDKASTQKNLSRISSFIRRQYERARSKFTSHNNNTSQQQRIPINTNTVKTCTKATSTTPLHHLTGEHSLAYSTKSPSNGCYRQTTNNYRAQYLPTSYKHSSYTEPVIIVIVCSLNEKFELIFWFRFIRSTFTQSIIPTIIEIMFRFMNVIHKNRHHIIVRRIIRA